MEVSRELHGVVWQGRNSAASTKLLGSFPATRSALPWKVLVALLVTAQPRGKRLTDVQLGAGAFSAGRPGSDLLEGLDDVRCNASRLGVIKCWILPRPQMWSTSAGATK